MIALGPVTLPNRAFLAPMSGVSDLPFRRLAARFGAGLVVSEMVACGEGELEREESRLRAEGDGLPVHAVQLSGREPEAMRLGVKVAEAAGASLIDINMGCPAKKVTGGYGGSALMRDLDRALSLIDAVAGTARVPVTLKMRLGWDETSINAPELARRAVAAGVRMITVHGRTRCQFYKGRADWRAIGNVARSVTVPVVANGDLVNAAQAPAMLRQTGADAVMIGRGAYGRPWIVGQAAACIEVRTPPPAPRGPELADLVAEHYDMMLTHYGLQTGVRVARKHLGWYLDGLGAGVVPESLRRLILTAIDHRAVASAVGAAFAPADLRAAA